MEYVDDFENTWSRVNCSKTALKGYLVGSIVIFVPLLAEDFRG